MIKIDNKILKFTFKVLGICLLMIVIAILISIGFLFCLNTLFNAQLEYSFINITVNIMIIMVILLITTDIKTGDD